MLLTTHHQSRTRRGFTLVEVLTAAALTLFIMAIMATAFQVGLDSLSHLKGAATLSDQLRTVKGIMQRDLDATHLEDEDGNEVLLSQLNGRTWLGTSDQGRKGYFLVQQPTAPSPTLGDPYFTEVSQALDVDGVGSQRATNHVLSMTVKLEGDKKENALVAEAPLNMVIDPSNNLSLLNNPTSEYASKWGQVTYFLVPVRTNPADPTTAITTSDDNGLTPIPLYTLHRRQQVLSMTTPPTPILGTGFVDISTDVSGNINSAATITLVANRFGTTSNPRETTADGSDILLSNVVSFQVRLMVKSENPATAGDYEYKDLPTAGSFDSANPETMYPEVGGFKQNVIGLQIKVRVYDIRQKMTRQITIEQKL